MLLFSEEKIECGGLVAPKREEMNKRAGFGEGPVHTRSPIEIGQDQCNANAVKQTEAEEMYVIQLNAKAIDVEKKDKVNGKAVLKAEVEMFSLRKERGMCR